MFLKLITLFTLTLLLNIPLGYLRRSTRKFSFLWFVYIHASIPALYFTRTKLHIGFIFIPAVITLAIIGQWLGNRFLFNRQAQK